MAFSKTSLIVKDIFKRRSMFRGEAQTLKPHQVGVHRANRNGHMPNLLYIYDTLTPNVQKDGFDPRRARPGIVIHCATAEKVARQLAYNESCFESAPGMWPPIDREKMLYFSLAFSHMTIKLRLHEANHTCTSTGRCFKAISDDSELQYAIATGHSYIVLSEDTTDEEAKILSEWYNSDQDQNNSSTEASLLRSIASVCRPMLASGPHIKVATVTQQVLALA